ncbi:MAG: hypothetical protein F6K19_41600, partial [Cyanothece sp. SIO1E1]|nr:hypothetical protein [Cyanothece sp. SIO1E1]
IGMPTPDPPSELAPEQLNFYLITETDVAFRLRLKSVVTLFAGGGTIAAIKGAVRSALGLPYDLNQLNLPTEFKALRDAIDNLIRVEEFSPEVDRLLGDRPQPVSNASELILEVEAESVQEITPQIRWTFTQGGGRRLSLKRLDTPEELRAQDDFIVPEGATLTFASEPNGTLSALLDGLDVASAFVTVRENEADPDQPEILPPRLPEVPRDRSEWRFRAEGGVFEISTFDQGDIFGLPEFFVEFRWVRFQPLTFDVYVPYFLQAAVQELKQQYGYNQDIFVFEGIPREQIQAVVNQTKAAGVRGNVQFSLNFYETHNQIERFQLAGLHATREAANMTEALDVGSFNRELESHDVAEVFSMGAVFDVSTFDSSFSFQE